VKTISEQFRFLELKSNEVIKLTKDQIVGRDEIPPGIRFAANDLTSPGESEEKFSVKFGQREHWPNPDTHWRTNKEGIETLRKLNRLFAVGDRLAWKRKEDDFPFVVLNNNWPDTAQGGMALDKIYVVQTVETTIERCVLMASDPGDVIFDPHLWFPHHCRRSRTMGPPLDHLRYLPRGHHPRPNNA
jgi:adenine-specific DNA-methyltransferase